MILTVIVAYLSVVLLVGLLGHRLFRGTGEDFFLASRGIGSFVLLMTLFGTNMTAFTMLGASGEAHRHGIGVYAFLGTTTAVIVPVVFLFVGTRAWRVGKRGGYLTQVQLFRDRYQSDALGLLIFIVLLSLLVPYVLIGVKGGGDALAAMTRGNADLPAWVGSLMVCAVVFAYVTYGGMRSTAWANTFQTLVFMIVGAAAFFVILGGYGGLGAAMETLRDKHPDLLILGKDRHTLLKMASYLVMPVSVGVFPHIFGHWLSARSARSFRVAIVAYPVCVAAVWVPSVVLGAVGRIDFPPPQDGPILVRLILENAGGVLAGCLAAGVFAAIMSSLDSQTLAVGTMFTQDIVRHYGFHDSLSERQQVAFGRLFVMVFLALAFAAAQLTSRSIFSLGVWTLTGYAGLFPCIVAALFWRRSTMQGVAASVVTTASLWTYFFVDSLGAGGGYTVAGSGVMPVAVILAGSVAALVLMSFATAPPPKEVIDRFFPARSTDGELKIGTVSTSLR